uniref:Uncharacterized protein n=1 Tax=Plectus sambesii TaxID=2011161 RepID=A0A914WKZ7_9BILA
MEAIHNAAENVKEFAQSAMDKITGGDGKVTDKDILKAADRVDELQQKRFEKNVEAEKDIVKAAKKLDEEKYDAYLKSLDKKKDIGEAVGKYASEQRRKEMIDAQGAARINDVALETGNIQRENVIYGDSHTPVKNVANAVEKQLDVQHDQFKKDIDAEKRILSAAEEIEKEAHKQKLKNLEASKDVAEAAQKLEKERQKQVEIDMAAEVKIRDAANRLEELKAKQMQQRCQEAIIAPAVVTSDTGRVIHIEKRTAIQ